MKNRKHARRVKRLSLIVTLCAIILVVSTYAWFIGMRTVNVSTFDVKIAATDGLTLSLDGKTWAETVTINQGNYFFDEEEGATNVVYKGNTNTWGGDGLVPLSTVGAISTTDSRLIMYEKGSLTATTGGYRLLASQIDNTIATTKTGEEGTGFVAFDLFIKNLSGNEYYSEFDVRNEEAIYLTQESKVEIANAGDKQDKTGIENSVRVAFAQIGRVEADATTSTETVIQGITCTGDTNVTGVCSKGAQIWEPNDTKHVTNAINWYNEACKGRSGDDVNVTGSYGVDKTDTNDVDESKCITVSNGVYYPTYAINQEIKTKKNVADSTYLTGVDVYDGYNHYTKTIKGKNGDGTDLYEPLTEFDYFTDTEKMQVGLDRPQFFSLAPNSITKVRVYVYIEGQDIDNYDFASLGKAIKVNFGFTKERFFDTDIDYDGPMTVTKEDQSAVGGQTTIDVPTTKSQQS